MYRVPVAGDATAVVTGTLLLLRRVSTSNSSESGKRRDAISRRGDGGCSIGNLSVKWRIDVSTISRNVNATCRSRLRPPPSPLPPSRSPSRRARRRVDDPDAQPRCLRDLPGSRGGERRLASLGFPRGHSRVPRADRRQARDSTKRSWKLPIYRRRRAVR